MKEQFCRVATFFGAFFATIVALMSAPHCGGGLLEVDDAGNGGAEAGTK